MGLRLVALFYRGNEVSCPVCGHSFKRFLPYGRISRSNALCPNCLALERHRLLWLYLKDKTRLFHDLHHFLHIAPEICFIHRFEQLTNLNYVTADLESPLAKVKMDIHHIPFPENTFDAVMCNHVLEHVNDDIRAMKEVFRVLKPNGWAILQVPFFPPVKDSTYEDPAITDPKDREKLYGQSDHVRMYGKDYPERLRSAGFHVLEDDYVRQLGAVEIKKYALPEDEIVFFCTKA